MSRSAAADAAPAVSASALFVAFLKIGLSGFGGVLSLSQFLPGPNIVNVSIIVGRRFQGVAGSVAACLGLLMMPLIIVLALASIYAQFAQVEAVRGACNGISSAASGLILAMALRMA